MSMSLLNLTVYKKENNLAIQEEGNEREEIDPIIQEENNERESNKRKLERERQNNQSIMLEKDVP